VKVSSAAGTLATVSAQDMIKAVIAGQRDPQVLAGLARTRMRARHDDLVAALDGMSGDHHGELAALLPGQIAFPGGRIARLAARAAGLTAAMPAARGLNADRTTGPDAGAGCGRAERRGPAGPDPRASAPAWPGPSSPGRARI